MRRTSTRLLPAILLLGTVTSGCSTMSHHADCALIGAGVGTAAGLGIAILDNEDTGVVIGSGAVGAALGALAGYGFCVITD